MTRGHLAALGVLSIDAPVPEGLRQVGDHLVDPDAWDHWGQHLADVVDAHHAETPLEAGLFVEAARRSLGLPDIRLVEALVRDSGGRLTARAGRVARPGSGPSFSEAAGRALDDIRQRLEQDPLAAPEAQELAAAGLTKGVLAAAANAGLVLRLPGEVILHPSAPERAVATIAQLDQPFTLSQARQALGTTRRVAVPLLEHLDATGRTVRIDAALRRVQPNTRSSAGS
jgi:selenocysteine-specific elongation factor